MSTTCVRSLRSITWAKTLPATDSRDSMTVTTQRFMTVALVDCHNISVFPLLWYAARGPGTGDEAVESM